MVSPRRATASHGEPQRRTVRLARTGSPLSRPLLYFLPSIPYTPSTSQADIPFSMFSKLRRKLDKDSGSDPVERSTDRGSESEPPPLYGADEGASSSQHQQQQQQPQPPQGYNDSKGNQSDYQQPQQHYNQNALPQSFGQEGAPLEYHIYRAPGKFRDEIVTGPDKNFIYYYIDYSIRFSGAQTVITKGGQDGPLVCTSSQGWSTTKNITMANGWTTQLFRTNALTFSHEYRGFDGQSHFKWVVNRFTNDFTVHGSKIFVAKWDNSHFSFMKEGKLFISPAYANETELIVITGTAVSEWLHEHNR
ncbi:BZ3500_MvSof-1268-A1-R1_Chr3-1g05682 [Microbotryum saponariae]|uniref:BZ3500_MvSof-1268-A1-R1_Chr3-1g05682 protein n=1 Tax=Microbotryum saponariae TaxID=289078 RepID=A0A2X0NBG7_9BASI|nr:BZ3500_MvSof-1268-A1-R1_Chr3-1g05682 [Microbotryum saponariae]SDA04872.1 BZ3501_MvSof-1269-A2-R1_Chr3-1g05352 [Microbotryum saponariae]